jgi:hypothetical protein
MAGKLVGTLIVCGLCLRGVGSAAEATGLTSVQAIRILVEVHAVPGVTKVENRLHIGM